MIKSSNNQLKNWAHRPEKSSSGTLGDFTPGGLALVRIDLDKLAWNERNNADVQQDRTMEWKINCY